MLNLSAKTVACDSKGKEKAVDCRGIFTVGGVVKDAEDLAERAMYVGWHCSLGSGSWPETSHWLCPPCLAKHTAGIRRTFPQAKPYCYF